MFKEKIFFKIISIWLIINSINCSDLETSECVDCQINIPTEVICQCNGLQFDIRKQFSRISQQLSGNTTNEKHFQSLNLLNAKFVELPENSFLDITFDYIFIINPINLKIINANAFNGTDLTLKRFYLWGENLELLNDPLNNDLWQAISSLVNIEYLSLSLGNGSVHEIPSYAFNSPQKKLTQIVFDYKWFGYNISNIGDYAFYGLQNLQNWITFTGIPIEKISSHAFDFGLSHETFLRIDLSFCQLKEFSFENGVFSGSKRPLFINLAYNQIKFIKEDIFSDFLKIDKRNAMNIRQNPLECDESEHFQWILKQKYELLDQILEPYCKNGTLLWDLNADTFGNSTAILPNLYFTIIFTLFYIYILKKM